MATIGSLAINVLARTGAFSRGMGRVRGELRGFSKLGRGLNVILGPVGAGLVGVGGAGLAVSKGISSARSFTQKMANSLAIMGDVSADTQAKMVQAAKDVAFTTKFSASDAAEAYFFLASAGLDAEASLAALPKVAAFAQAGNFDLALATDLITDAQSALGLSSKDAAENMMNMARVSDVLVKANTLANASVEQFSTALTNKAGAALRVVGKDVEEGVAVLAAFADQGVKGADAGTALNIVMRDLQTKALQNAAAFKAAGVTVFDQAGEMLNLATIVGQLEGKLEGLSDAQKKATLLQLGFTDKSIAFIQTLLGTSEKIAGYEAALRSAGGTTAEVASKQLPPLEQGLNKIRALFEALSISVLGPGLEALGALLGPIVDDLRALDSAGLQKTFTGIFQEAAIGAAEFLDQLTQIQRTFDDWVGQFKRVQRFSDRLQTFSAFRIIGDYNRFVLGKLFPGGGAPGADEPATSIADRVRARFEELNAAAQAEPKVPPIATSRFDAIGKALALRQQEMANKAAETLDEAIAREPPAATSRFDAIGKALALKQTMEDKAERLPFERASNELALRGSREAVSAIQQFRFRGGGKESVVDKEQLNVAKKANEILRKVNTGIEGIRDNLTTFSIPAGGGAAA